MSQVRMTEIGWLLRAIRVINVSHFDPEHSARNSVATFGAGEVVSVVICLV
jgi:hypothetical protein